MNTWTSRNSSVLNPVCLETVICTRYFRPRLLLLSQIVYTQSTTAYVNPNTVWAALFKMMLTSYIHVPMYVCSLLDDFVNKMSNDEKPYYPEGVSYCAELAFKFARSWSTLNKLGLLWIGKRMSLKNINILLWEDVFKTWYPLQRQLEWGVWWQTCHTYDCG